MTSIFLKASSFIVIILLGIFTRLIGLLPENAGDITKKIMLYLTLPCALALNFSGSEGINLSFSLIALLSILFQLAVIGGILKCTETWKPEKRALWLLCTVGMNIGAFTIPFVQNFLPGSGVVATCLYDTGNSIMCTGITFAIAQAVVLKEKSTKPNTPKILVRSLLKSPPFVTYVTLFLLVVCFRVRIPQPVITFLSPFAGANTFLAMLTIGLLFRLELKKEYLQEIGALLAVRYALAGICAVIFFLFLPYPIEVRKALAVATMSPCSAVSPIYLGECGGDSGKAGCINSISIMISLSFMIVLMGLFGLNG